MYTHTNFIEPTRIRSIVIRIRFLLTVLLLCLCNMVQAETPSLRHDPEQIRKMAEEFLKQQTAEIRGEISITVGTIDPRLKFAQCQAPEVFLPNRSMAWGKTTVGVRCKTANTWTVFIPANVKIITEYLATSMPLTVGQTLEPSHLLKLKGDITALPPGVLTDSAQAIGHTLSVSLASGMPVRKDALKIQQAIKQGQTIRVVSAGPGFKVSTEAHALNNANEGQMAQAKTISGQTVSGIAKNGGIVEVSY